MTKRLKKTLSKQKAIKQKAKPKKITVKFFLNKALHPATDQHGKKLHPLYMLITFNRKNMMLKSYYGMYFYDLEEAADTGLVEFERKIITRTIEYERQLQGDQFSLKGINEKYARYAVSIYTLFETYLKRKLHRLASHSKPHEFAFALNFNDATISFSTLHTIATRIYPDFSLPKEFQDEVEAFYDFGKLYGGFPIFEYNFPTVIEWLDESLQRDYRSKLEVVYKKDQKMIDHKIALMDRIVKESFLR